MTAFTKSFRDGAGFSGRRGVLWALLIVTLCIALSTLQKPGGKAENAAIEQRERTEQAMVDACNLSIAFEHPRAKIGFTKVARTLPDGRFLVVVPFTVGKAERQARCVGTAAGLAEFAVERAS